jgi:hypothetical protein
LEFFMSNCLGRVIGNRFTGVHAAPLKPNLRERLAQESCRATALGLIATGPHGRLSFVPNYLLQGWERIEGDRPAPPLSAFQPGQRVRVTASVRQLELQESAPFLTTIAEAVTGREGVVVEHTVCKQLALVAVEMDGQTWGFMPAHLEAADPAEGDDEREAMAGGPSFDPYAEPLALGDTVQGMDGRIGCVTFIEPQRLGVMFERGSAWCGDMNRRGSFRLLARAAPGAG